MSDRSIIARVRSLLDASRVLDKPLPAGRTVADLVAEQIVKEASKGKVGNLRLLLELDDASIKAPPTRLTRREIADESAAAESSVPEALIAETLFQLQEIVCTAPAARDRIAAAAVIQKMVGDYC
jgi:hypothetical protein